MNGTIIKLSRPYANTELSNLEITYRQRRVVSLTIPLTK